MFGRPLAIASHHFDTQLPSASDPVLFPSEPRVYLPNLSLFRAYILRDIMDSAVSQRPVPYDFVLASDRSLTVDGVPLGRTHLGEFRVARSLASFDVTTHRLGVQSVIIHTSHYHIRFTLHRPCATAPSTDKLITLVRQARPATLANASLAVPGHMNWGPFHVSAPPCSSPSN